MTELNDDPYLRWQRGEISEVEYQNELAKQKGFKDRNEETKASFQKRGFKTRKEYREYLARQKGYTNRQEYYDDIARKKGYKDHNDYRRQTTEKRKATLGLPINMQENKECSLWLGVVIAEKVLSKVFKNVERMSTNNPGYDFICNKGFKVDVKSACLDDENIWEFRIKRNKIADYFLLLAFNNREDLEPEHLWLIKGTDKVKKKIINEIASIVIRNNPLSMYEYEDYELTDKLEKVKDCCDKLREKD